MAQGEEGAQAWEDAKSITESAVLVAQMMNGDFSNIRDGTTIETSGMGAKELVRLIDTVYKSGKNVKFVNEYD